MRKKMRLTVQLLLFVGAGMLASACVSAQPEGSLGSGIKVVSSIKPLTLLIEPLLHEEDALKTLIAPGASPHHFSLQVSHMSQLVEADLVVWVGPELERFLTKPLSNIPVEMQLLVYQQAGDKGERSNVSSNEHQHTADPHLWLSPLVAIDISERVGNKLASMQPQYAEYYIERVKEQVKRLQGLHEELLGKLEPLKGIGFIAYHPAYKQFVSAYSLNQIGTVTASPEIPMGARRLYELQKQVEEGKARCLFIETSHASPKTSEVARQLGLRMATLDPLGQSESTHSYSKLMRLLANDMANCLLADSSVSER